MDLATRWTKRNRPSRFISGDPHVERAVVSARDRYDDETDGRSETDDLLETHNV